MLSEIEIETIFILFYENFENFIQKSTFPSSPTTLKTINLTKLVEKFIENISIDTRHVHPRVSTKLSHVVERKYFSA